MISRANRFHGRAGISYVYRNGQSYRGPLLTIKIVPNVRRKDSRIAVVVSRKIYKSAVKRNRIRRRIYEHVRSLLPTINTAHDMLVIVTSGDLLTISHDEVVGQIDKLLKQAKILAK